MENVWQNIKYVKIDNQWRTFDYSVIYAQRRISPEIVGQCCYSATL